MNLGEAIVAIRGRLDDLAPPFLWKDDFLIGALNSAQDEAAIRSKLLYDLTTPSVCEIGLKAGQASYALHSSIFQIDRAALASNHRVLTQSYVPDEDEDDRQWQTRTGQVCRYILEREGSILLVRVPEAVDTLKLRVWRTALRRVAEKEDCFEIGAKHHERMLDWAIRLAYLRRDSDTYDEKKAQDHEDMFTASFGIRETADVYRKQRLRRKTVVKARW